MWAIASTEIGGDHNNSVRARFHANTRFFLTQLFVLSGYKLLYRAENRVYSHSVTYPSSTIRTMPNAQNNVFDDQEIG